MCGSTPRRCVRRGPRDLQLWGGHAQLAMPAPDVLPSGRRSPLRLARRRVFKLHEVMQALVILTTSRATLEMLA